MPLLDFQCISCGKKFTELVYSHNKDSVTCPKCEGNEIKQIYEGKCYQGTTISTKNNGSSPMEGGGCRGGCCPMGRQ